MKDVIGLVPPVAALLIRALHSTLRVRHAYAERIEDLNRAGKNYVYSFWHGHIMVMVYALFARPATVMISRHKDGELIARTMARFGIEAARGSSSRGGSEALREMLRAARDGKILIITPDGPRGPRRIAQPGVVRAAQIAGIPIIPAAVVAKRRKRLPSWDGFEIPFPFARALYLYGEPIMVPRELSPELFESARLDLERRTNALIEEGEMNFERLWEEAKG